MRLIIAGVHLQPRLEQRRRIRGQGLELDPEQQGTGPEAALRAVYQALQDNFNYIALARSWRS
jgi:hypothetical protein